MNDLEGLEIVLNYIKDKSIVCPKPQYWNYLWDKGLDGHNEKWINDDERKKCYPLILGNWWGTEDDHKHQNFVNSIEYFYNKYPNKRKKIEDFILKLDQDRWYFGESPNRKTRERW